MKQNILNLVSKLILEHSKIQPKQPQKQVSPNSCRLFTLIMFTKRLANPSGNIYWIWLLLQEVIFLENCLMWNSLMLANMSNHNIYLYFRL